MCTVLICGVFQTREQVCFERGTSIDCQGQGHWVKCLLLKSEGLLIGWVRDVKTLELLSNI